MPSSLQIPTQFLFQSVRLRMGGHLAILTPRNKPLPPSLLFEPFLCLSHLICLGKLLRRLVQASLGNFGWLSFHASRLNIF